MPMTYDENNIFAKILRGEIPNKTVYENDHVLAFYDIAPHVKTHVLVIPKGAYMDVHDFNKNATDYEIIAYGRALAEIVEKLELTTSGFRIVSNCKTHGGQEVPHYHTHILGGETVGPMVSKNR